MMRWVLCVCVGVLLVACGGGKSENDQAADALKRDIGFLNAGQYRRAYDMIHPAQQAFIPFDLYEKCTRQRFQNVASLTAGKVQEVYDEPFHIEGTDQTVPAKAVTLNLTANGAGRSQTTTETAHVIKVGDGWRVTASGADAYKQGTCPT